MIENNATDIRSKNFSKCSLSSRDFSYANCGVKNHTLLLSLIFVALVLSGFGIQIALSSILTASEHLLSKVIFWIFIFSFLIYLYCRGFVETVTINLSIGFVLFAILMAFGHGELSKIVANGVFTGLIGGFLMIAGELIIVLAITTAVVLTRKSIRINLLIAVFISAIITALLDNLKASLWIRVEALGLVFIVCLAAILITDKVLARSRSLDFIYTVSVAFAAFFGTCFRDANLTSSVFWGADLKNSDLRNANLTRTSWKNVKNLDLSRLENTYLFHPEIRQLVVTCNGQGQNFDGLDLAGVNLQDGNLQDASFVGASLNQSNLRGADLSRVILKQTQLDGADLTGAVLTGAYIEDWGITSKTNLENVQCEYIYMRVPTKENPNPLRKPDNLRETFADGEFTDFIQPFFDTLDLYHNQDVDPRAISIALRNLSTNHPDDDLQFVAMERRGSNGINLRFTTAPRANKSELSHEYFANYAQIKKELPVAIQMQLAEQDAEIRTLKGTIEQFIQTGTHQSTIQAENIQIIQGELVVTENKGININTGDNANISGLSSGDGIVNLGIISGNVTNAINQLPQDPESDQPNLKELLTQLQQAIQTDADLSDPDKLDLLEQVQALAEVKQTEEPAKREGLARKVMKIFDATLKSLPDTAKIAEACSKLLPLILKALGFPA